MFRVEKEENERSKAKMRRTADGCTRPATKATVPRYYFRQRRQPSPYIRRPQLRERGQIRFTAEVFGQEPEEAGQCMAIGLDRVGGGVAFLLKPAKEGGARSLAGHRRDRT